MRTIIFLVALIFLSQVALSARLNLKSKSRNLAQAEASSKLCPPVCSSKKGKEVINGVQDRSDAIEDSKSLYISEQVYAVIKA